MTDDFGPVQTGFSLARAFGWWDDGDGTDGQLPNNRPPATLHYEVDNVLGQVGGATSNLPPNFPSEEVAPIEGDLGLYEVIYQRPFSDPGDVTSATRTELTLGQSGAASFEGFSDVTVFDNADPNVRGRGMLTFDYKLVPLEPSAHEIDVFPGFPIPRAHPSDSTPYDVINTWEQENWNPVNYETPTVDIRFGLTYRDEESLLTSPCDDRNPADVAGCWQYVGAGVTAEAENFDTVDDSEDPTIEIIDQDDASWFTLIADGQVHTAQIPFVFLTQAEREAAEWRNGIQGQPYVPELVDSQDPNVMETLRFDTRGPTPRLLVFDNFRLSTIEGIPGDFNEDGVVDAADYTVYRDNIGADSLPNDEGLGTVGAAHLQLWEDNYGLPTASPGSSTTIPEPTAMALLLAGAAGCLTANRRS